MASAWLPKDWLAPVACGVGGAIVGYLVAVRCSGHEASAFYREQKSSGLSLALHDYVVRSGTRPTPEHAAIEEYTKKLGRISRMMITADEGQALAWLCRSINARVAVEVGCFTGYGTLWIASGVTDRVFTLDISEEHLGQARKQWDSSGLGSKIHHLLGDANKSLAALRKVGTGPDAPRLVAESSGEDPKGGEGGDGTVDFAFIDADKSSYAGYVEAVYKLLRKGGICAIDNTLWGGRVVNPDVKDEDTVAIRKLNESLHGDERWDICMIPVADGVTLLRKR
jgi:predicted O-methyltransferase YrrM